MIAQDAFCDKFLIFGYMLTQQQANIIKDITRRFNPTLVGVFGSYARGEQTTNSDLDILIDFQKRVNLLDIVALEEELSEKLQVRVDLVTVKSLNHQLKPFIEKDLIRLDR